MTGLNDKKLEFALEINDLTVSYKDKPVLWDIDLEIPQGALVGIVGAEWRRENNSNQIHPRIVEASCGFCKNTRT